MKYRKGSFVTIPNRNILKGLLPSNLAVYFWICDHSNEDGECFPSRQRLADEAGVSLRTVDSAITVLIKLGLLSKITRKNGKENFSNLYQIIIIDEDEPSAAVARPSSMVALPPRAKKDTVTKPTLLTKPKEVEDFAGTKSSPSSSDTHSNSNKIQYSQIHSNNDELKETPVDEFENQRPQKIPKEQKVSLRKFQLAFSDMAYKTLGTRPIFTGRSLKIISYAVNTAGLSEKLILDLFDEWFSRSDKKDEDLIQIHFALSSANINGYKVRNQIK